MLLKNGIVLDDKFLFRKLDIAIMDDRILELAPNIHPVKGSGSCEVIDLDGALVVPGLVDIHVHGAGGEDYCNADIDGIEKIARCLARSGVTSFLATSLSMPSADLEQLYRMTGQYISEQRPGSGAASLLGIYMEGPYFSVQKRGAQDEANLRQPDFEEYRKLQKISGYAIKVVCVAPELPGAMEFIRKATDPGEIASPVLSIGHTICDYEQAKQAFEAGVSHITHLYNGMQPFTHREPGVLGALSENNSVTAEIICDGVHVHPAAVRMAFRLATTDRMILISDGLASMGYNNVSEGFPVFKFGKREILFKNGIATLEDGTLAGGSLNLLECVKKAIEFGIDQESAFKAATMNPARAIGLDKEIGSIAVGKRADLLILHKDLKISAVYSSGKPV